MKYNRIKWFGFLLIFVLLLTSCAGTKIKKEYTDDAFTGKVSNILVIALIGSAYHQTFFETELVSQLKSMGVDAVSSREVMVMPSDMALTREMILNAIRQHENDAVIISRIIGKEEMDNYRADQYSRSFYDFYVGGYSYLNRRGSMSSSTSVLLETDLFDVKTEKMIWNRITKTLLRDPQEGDVSRDAIAALVNELNKCPFISR